MLKKSDNIICLKELLKEPSKEFFLKNFLLNKNFKDSCFEEIYSKNFQIAKKIKLDKKEIKEAIFSKAYIVFVDGFLDLELSEFSSLGIKVEEQKAASYGKERKEEFFFSLCDALCQREVHISIPQNISSQTILQIIHVAKAPSSLILPKIYFEVGKNSSISILTSSLNGAHNSWIYPSYFFNLEEKAKVNYLSFSNFPSSFYFQQFFANLKKDASLDLFLMTQGGVLERGDYKINLMENASFVFNSLTLLNGKNKSHLNLSVNHEEINSSSSVEMRAILEDEAKSFFKTKVLIKKEAQLSKSSQLCKHLLLSDLSRAYAEPILQVFADDIKATHGATFFNLKEEELFYLCSRGIEKNYAKELLIKGFCQEMLNLVKIEEMKEKLQERLFLKGKAT
jgi:Fe-S cluster assembly protein SufD